MAEKKILIVDYDSKSLDYLSGLFESYEFKILKATDGLSAYETYKSEKPDLIILEAMLPKMHGFDLTKKISQETDGKLPIIIVTGLYRGSQYRNEALNFLGASDYFEKPVDEGRLKETVLNYLELETEIREELPNPDSVFSSISNRIKAKPKDKDAGKKKKVVEETKAEPSVSTKELNDSWDSALSDIDVDVSEELASLVQKKKRTQEQKVPGGK